MADTLDVVEIKAFVPARDFALSQQFYIDIGFRLCSSGGGVAYLSRGECAFLLQDFYVQAQAENFMMHLLVADADAWHAHLLQTGVAERYGTRITALEDQPWRMRDFCFIDPSGVLWRVGHNI